MEWMLIVLQLVLAVGCLVMLWSVWMLVCNQRTYRKRVQLIENRKNLGPRWMDRFWEEWRAVEYKEHLWALARFRNPRELYGPVVSWVWDRPNILMDQEPVRGPLVEDTRDYLAAITGGDE